MKNDEFQEASEINKSGVSQAFFWGEGFPQTSKLPINFATSVITTWILKLKSNANSQQRR